MARPTRKEPAPLDAEERARIWRWQRGMIAFYAFAMTSIAAGTYVLARFGEVAAVRQGALAAIALLVVAGAYVQFRERCPRCGSLLGRQSRLMLPLKCRSCGVPFPRPLDRF
jgi:hypothetical protein